jgi:hypothetical protein
MLWVTPASADPLFDIVLLLDESGSVSAQTFTQEKNVAVDTANALTFGPNDTAASLIMHATSARTIQNFTTIKPTFINSVNNVAQALGSSNFTAGFTAAQNQFNNFGRAGATKIICVLGDGQVGDAGLVPKLNELSASGVHIFSYLLPGGSPSFMQSLVRNEGQYGVLNDFNGGASDFVNDIYAILSTIPGDYNYNGVVDAADYPLWRLKLGTSGQLINDGTPDLDGVQQADYDVWRAQFGQVYSGPASAATVPEPSTLLLLAIATLATQALVRNWN